ncbi:DUF4406 domain-containing protein [Bacteroides gallinaceum]|uniref:DUF4406 domain-containing protein n=1 Tax=Bacteroides gallinaceum TaxID=1462571 RepID=UPI0025AADBA7|nr:DUF4406 domain-containing protein [Bacteroides gallinaceum]MDN0078402.1 DUF4406 domain-containing protein [Bacteroides gallinaceum]
MKIYISLPITGHDIEKVEASCIYASGVIQAKGHTPVSPLDISPDPDATYSEHMGNDIEALLNCDAVLFMENWRTSKGCRLENAAAEIYDKQVFYSLDRIPNTDIQPPESCPYYVKDFKECKSRCETIIGKGKRKINCTCDYYIKNMLIEIENLKIK